MKVIKHGKILRFTCYACEAEYVAGIIEATNCGFFYEAACPDCGRVNKAKEAEEAEEAEESDK